MQIRAVGCAPPCLIAALALMLNSATAAAQRSESAQDSARSLSLAAFIDAYYAYDVGQPNPPDRPYTTQALRHNEFNINLVFVEIRADRERVRGRLALQAGTSVQANYAGEPRHGAVSGPDLVRHIQEAVIGVRIAPALWLDGGLYFSHIGHEGWISRDNRTYTRSLAAEFTPYYQTGVRLSWLPTPALAVQAHLLNGWQNVSETNGDKALGLRIDVVPRAGIRAAYVSFLGNEAPDGAPSRLRFFNQLLALWQPTTRIELQAGVDYGSEARPENGQDHWYSVTVVGSMRATRTVGVAARVERFADASGVVVRTGLGDAFKTTGASVSLDVAGPDGLLWRNEVRGFRADGAIYPDPGGGLRRTSLVLVSSLAVTLR